MNYIIAASTDIGIKKNTNQDSLTVKTLNTPRGKMVFALLCDGMGGLAKGEVASAELIEAFDSWIAKELALICSREIEERTIKEQWKNIAKTQNIRIKEYGDRQGINLGTTVVAMLLTQKKYYIMNIGDSRAYEISNGLRQITKDQTLIQREIDMGNLTPEAARIDPRRNVLLQCVGATDSVNPDFFFGNVAPDSVYMLCSDGFRHEISDDEIAECFAPRNMYDENSMKHSMDYLIELNKSRMEKDNISVITVRTYTGGAFT